MMQAFSHALEARISRRALKALGEIPGLSCGGLSPLARIAPPPAASDRVALVAALERLEGDWEWAAPALLDPRLTLALLLGDSETQLAGQYLWPDPAGTAPGFQLTVEDGDVVLRGPATLDQAELTLKDFLALGGVAEVEPVALHASSDELWALAALADAHHLAALLRCASRITGPPVGLRVKDVVATWTAGLAEPHLGWAVSLFALLAPEAVPADFANRLPAVLAAMARAGLVAALEAAPGDPLGDLYLLGDALFSLCRARSFAAVQFGVLLQSAGAPGQTETLRLAGWRTAGGIVAADLSALSEGRAEVLLLGPSGFSDLVRTALHADVAATAGPFAPSPDYTRAALLESLKPRPPLGPAPATTQTLAIPGRPALRLVREGSQDGALLKDGTTVGRDEACDLVIAESSTSRKHARIEATPQGWQVRDLGSSNGTWRNGVRIVDVAPIQPADALVFGKTRFRVEPA